MTQLASAMKACTKSNSVTPEHLIAEGCFISELSNSADDPGISIARARLEPGNLKPNHVSAGDVVLTPPAAHQRITNTGSIDLVFLAICSPRFTEAVYVDSED